MNVFAVDDDPAKAAFQLPDKHIVKMPLECCQMLSIVYSSWYHNIGKVFKADGTPYKTEKGAFRNHHVQNGLQNLTTISSGCYSMAFLCVKSIHIDTVRHTHVREV